MFNVVALKMFPAKRLLRTTGPDVSALVLLIMLYTYNDSFLVFIV